MGLFDVFGAGGGTLTIQMQAMQVAPGQTAFGVVTFTGGTRQQNITSIKVRLTMTHTQPTVPGKPPGGSSTKDVVPEQTLSGQFSVGPGQTCPFQFSLQLPPQMQAEVKGQIDYRVSASADIPGEVDAHANADIQVIGGAAVQQPMPGLPQMGEAVIGQHPMGGVHPGKVVALQDGMIGVDWDDPNLGQSTWLQPHQVQPGKPALHQGLAFGASVMAEHPKLGGWHAGKVVAQQNGMIGVDWADAKLGDSSWLEPHRVQPGK